MNIGWSVYSTLESKFKPYTFTQVLLYVFVHWSSSQTLELHKEFLFLCSVHCIVFIPINRVNYCTYRQ